MGAPAGAVEAVGRAEFAALADRHLAAVLPHLSEDCSLVLLPGGRDPARRASDGLEGFARTTMLLGFRAASVQEPPSDLIDGALRSYRSGLAAGSLPGGSWPRIGHRTQSRVEAAGLVVGLWAGRRQLWDPLPQAAKESVVAWLSGIDTAASWNNNQLMFPAVVNAFRLSVGAPHDEAALERSLATCERMYLGGGWYRDGRPERSGQHDALDWYNAWAFHFYLPLVAVMTGRDDLRQRYAERLGAYLHDHLRLVADDGTPIPYGRSLTYRYAMTAPCWSAGLLGVTDPGPGTLRDSATRTMQAFHGPRLDDLTSTGEPVTAGWLRPGATMLQSYSGPGSPYWLAKAFLGLVLPAEHPSWLEPPVRSLQPAVAWAGGGRLLVSREVSGAVVHLHPVRAGHDVYGDAETYRRLVYTTATPPTGYGAATDADLVVRGRTGPLTRRRSSGTALAEDSALTRHVFHVSATRQRVQRMLHRLPALARAELVTWCTGGLVVWVLRLPRGPGWTSLQLGTPGVTVDVDASTVSRPVRGDSTDLPGSGLVVAGSSHVLRAWGAGWSGHGVVADAAAGRDGPAAAHVRVGGDRTGGRLAVLAWRIDPLDASVIVEPGISVEPRRVTVSTPGRATLLVTAPRYSPLRCDHQKSPADPGVDGKMSGWEPGDETGVVL